MASRGSRTQLPPSGHRATRITRATCGRPLPAPRHPATHLGYLLILSAALLWATLGPVARFALRAGIDPLEIGFWRAAIGGLLFAAHAGARGRLRVAPRDFPAVAAFALVGVTIFFWSDFRAVE